MHWLQIARMYENQFMLLFAWVTGLGLATLLLLGARLFWKPAVWAIQRRSWLIFLGLWSAQLGVCWATSLTLLKWRYFVRPSALNQRARSKPHLNCSVVRFNLLGEDECNHFQQGPVGDPREHPGAGTAATGGQGGHRVY